MGGKSSKQKKNKNKNGEENNAENPAAEQKTEDKVEASGEGESKPADGAAPTTEEKAADGASSSEDKAADGDASKNTPSEEAKTEDGSGGTEVTLKCEVNCFEAFVRFAFGQGVISQIRKTALSLSLSCLLYTSPSPRDCIVSRMPSSA